ncbi:MAG: tetratricopeptide repeat protein [Nitrospinae bacterium]|nr:tetratricopeptide repeat protein [Nitrospinota bacterium]
MMGLLLYAAVLQAFAQAPGEEALFTIAVQAYQDGLYDVARSQLQTFLTAYPQGAHLPEVHYLLGDYFYRKSDYPRAAEHLREALQRRPEAAFRDDARYLLARSHFENGGYREAIQALQPLIEQGRVGRWYEAALYWTGEAWLSAGDFGAAARSLQQLVAESPTNEYLEHALYSLGYAWQRVDAHAQALQAFEGLLQRFPQSKLRRPAELGVARALLALQRYEAAASQWERLRTEAPSSQEAEDATFWWAESWAQAGRCEEARPAFHAYLEQFPQGPRRADALAVIGECAHVAGEFGDAIARIEELLQQSPTYPRRETILLRLADAYAREGQRTRAQEIYADWLQRYPNNPRRAEVLLRRGLLNHVQGDYVLSAQDFAEALRLTRDPSQQTLAHQMLGESYFRLGKGLAALDRHAEAIARYRQALAADPSDDVWAEILANLGSSLLNVGQVEEALTVYDQLLTRPMPRGETERLHLQLGLLYREREAREKAAGHLRAAAAGGDPGVAAEALYHLADLLLAQGAGEEGRALLQKLTTQLTSQPRWVGIGYYRLALVYEEEQAWPEAWKAYMAAAEAATDPTLVQAARERAKQLEETVDVQKRGIQAPRHPGIQAGERP